MRFTESSQRVGVNGSMLGHCIANKPLNTAKLTCSLFATLVRGLRGQIEAIWRIDTTIFNARYVDYFDCRAVYCSDNGTNCGSSRDIYKRLFCLARVTISD